jgi:hypothetical protein
VPNIGIRNPIRYKLAVFLEFSIPFAADGSPGLFTHGLRF